ncbi:ACP S-malonyltransferase [Williamsia sp.]|uniref:ACP S-malonyltransferase n=1 Tax=Williamsia sp. TaxID=1872085 RepID=UPI001A34679E|nr:ACP S-malonyltransferase [Williamsia sp.]MBJ7289688.1 ACP S-malonyltransferase [Williamsia sp.]
MTIGLIFPGQGSQSAGMGEPWRRTESFELAHTAGQLLGVDVERLLLSCDDDELRAPFAAQVATFVLSCIALDHLRARAANSGRNIVPAAVAGHSLGEYSALVAAGALTFEAGVMLVAERGAAMASAAQDRLGVMAASVGLDAATVAAICDRHGDCWPANENSADQIVISGTEAAVANVEIDLRDAGARLVRRLLVGGAYHSPLMAPAATRLGRALDLAPFDDAQCSVVCNVDAAPHTAATEIVELLGRQLTGRVRWLECQQTLFRLGITEVVEVGPGKVLTNLARRSLPGVGAHRCATPQHVDEFLARTDRRVA